MKRLPIVLQPSRRMTSVRIVVGPVDETALRIPVILALERDRIASLQWRHATREIDVVSEEHGRS